MNQTEIKAAIAQQEEHIKRTSSCTFPGEDRPRQGLSHSWDTFSTAPGGPKYRACWRCKVTETDADYQIKIDAAAQPGR